MQAIVVVILCLCCMGLLGMLLLLWDAHNTHKKNALATFKVLDQRSAELHNRLETVERSTTNTAAWEHAYIRPIGKKENAG